MRRVNGSEQTAPSPRPPRAPEAVIVAGGFGTRMLPLTERRPKHLLEVGGVPFLDHQVTKLAAAGVEHVVLATSYRADLFRPVLGDGERFGVRISYVTEDEPLGTAGAIRNVAAALSDDPDGAVVILNGDVLSGHDLAAQLADFERPRDGRPVDVSLHLVEVPDARAFGCVPTDDRGTGHRVRGEVRRPGHEPGQRRLLRLPPPGGGPDPGGARGLGRAGDVPRPRGLRRRRGRVRRDGLLARRGQPAGPGGRLARRGQRGGPDRRGVRR